MAKIDNAAFDYMQTADPDKYITGGAMEHSEYEMDMSPEEQEDFLRRNARLFYGLYNSDPNVDTDKVSYASYLENLDPKLIGMRSDDYEKESQGPGSIPGDGGGRFPEQYIGYSKAIDTHSKKHFGDIDRLRNMVLGYTGGAETVGE